MDREGFAAALPRVHIYTEPQPPKGAFQSAGARATRKQEGSVQNTTVQSELERALSVCGGGEGRRDRERDMGPGILKCHPPLQFVVEERELAPDSGWHENFSAIRIAYRDSTCLTTVSCAI